MSLPMYPYTNMSDTNLDWLIADNKLVHVEMKETTEYINKSKTYIDGKLKDTTTQAENAQSSAENAQSSAENAIASAERASDDAEYVKSTRNQVDLLQSRVDNIIPSGTQTEGNTELIDIRVAEDGTTYDSAGNAVRGQISDVLNLMSKLSGNDINIGCVEIINYNSQVQRKAWVINSTPVDGEYYYYNRYNNLPDVLYVTGHSWGDKYPLIAFYDSSDKLLKTFGKNSGEYSELKIIVPKNASYCYVNGWTLGHDIQMLKYSSNESINDVIINSISSVVDVCGNPNLTDLNDAKVNSIYRLYFSGNYSEIHVNNFPFESTNAVMGFLVTLGNKTVDNIGYRTQLLITESDGIFFRWASSNSYKPWNSLVNLRKTNKVTISSSDDVVQKMIDANKDNDITDIYFKEGDYDVIELYKRHYGDDFFDKYTGYDSGSHSFGRGLVCRNGKHYHFSTQAIFHAEYTGPNTNVKTFFSMFAPEYGQGFIIDGLTITESKGLRYGIHPDFITEPYMGGVGEFRNCYINTSDWCIGAGLHNGSTLKLIDSIFIQTGGDTVTVYVHTPNTQGDKARLVVNGCYFNNRLQIDRGGSNTTKSDAIVTNSSLTNLVNANNAFDLISFNNINHN